MTATEPVEVYRLKLWWGTQSSGSSDWRLYEARTDFEHDLLRSAIEAESRHFNHDRAFGKDQLWRAYDWWNEYILKRKDDDRKVAKIVGAEKLVDGQWVQLNYTLHPPRLEFHE